MTIFHVLFSSIFKVFSLEKNEKEQKCSIFPADLFFLCRACTQRALPISEKKSGSTPKTWRTSSKKIRTKREMCNSNCPCKKLRLYVCHRGIIHKKRIHSSVDRFSSILTSESSQEPRLHSFVKRPEHLNTCPIIAVLASMMMH